MSKHSTNNQISILLVGPLPIAGDHLGGAKAAFSQMIEDLNTQTGVEYDLVNLSRPLKNAGRFKRTLLNLQKLVATLYSIARLGRLNQVWVINVSPGGSFALLPCIRVMSWMFRKPVVVRMFGGSLYDDLRAKNPVVKKLYSWSLRGMSLLTLETKYLLEKFEHLNNVIWFPNTRNCIVEPKENKRCRKFIFLSQIRNEKGVSTILEAAPNVHPDAVIDLYGSVVDHELVHQTDSIKNVDYVGEVQPEAVTNILLQYDALLLPSYWEGEGHPGVIIEAFQCGLPVIATKWKQIPEIVTDRKDGILIAVNDSVGLAKAINQLVVQEQEYRYLCKGAIDSGENFRSVLWHKDFVDWCRGTIR